MPCSPAGMVWALQSPRQTGGRGLLFSQKARAVVTCRHEPFLAASCVAVLASPQCPTLPSQEGSRHQSPWESSQPKVQGLGPHLLVLPWSPCGLWKSGCPPRASCQTWLPFRVPGSLLRAPWEAAGTLPSAWVPPQLTWMQYTWLLGSAWPHPQYRGHLRGKYQLGTSLPLSLSL